MAAKNTRTNQKVGKVWVAAVEKDEPSLNTSDLNTELSRKEEDKKERKQSTIASKNQNVLNVSSVSKTKDGGVKEYSFNFLLDLAPKNRQIPSRLYNYLKSLDINAFGRKKSNSSPHKERGTPRGSQTIDKKKTVERGDSKITLKDLQMLFEVTKNQSEITVGQLKAFARQNRLRFEESKRKDVPLTFPNIMQKTHLSNSRSVSRKNSASLSRKNSTSLSHKNSTSFSRKNSSSISRKNSSISRKNSTPVTRQHIIARKNSTPLSRKTVTSLDKIARKKSAPLPYRNHIDDYSEEASKLDTYRHSFPTPIDETAMSLEEMEELKQCQSTIRKLQMKLTELHVRRQQKLAGREEDIRKLKESFQAINSRLQEQYKNLQKENAELSSIVSISDQENDKLQTLLSWAGEKNLEISHELEMVKANRKNEENEENEKESPEISKKKSLGPSREDQLISGGEKHDSAGQVYENKKTKERDPSPAFSGATQITVGDKKHDNSTPIKKQIKQEPTFAEQTKQVPLVQNVPYQAQPLQNPLQTQLLTQQTIQGGNIQPQHPFIPHQAMPLQFQQPCINPALNPPLLFGGLPIQPAGAYFPMPGLGLFPGGDQYMLPAQSMFGAMPTHQDGDLVGFCGTFYGSRYIQNRLETDPLLPDQTNAFSNMFFNQIKDRVHEVVVNKFGRFAFEKLVERCTDDQRGHLLQNLLPTIITTSCDPHGSFATQVLVKHLRRKKDIAIVIQTLKPSIFSLMTDPKGHYLVIVLISEFSEEEFSFIDETIISRCRFVSTNNEGLQVMKIIFKHRSVECLRPIVQAIAAISKTLIEDQYGNYVLQLAISKQYNDPSGVIQNYRRQIIENMQGSFRRLAQQKYSSNVIEACLKQRDCQPFFATVIEELLAPPNNAVKKLINDSFGNYVLQTVLLVANTSQLLLIKSRLTPHFASFKVNLREKWKKIINTAIKRAETEKKPN